MAVIKTVFVSGVDTLVANVPKERYKTWLSAETWRRIDERKELRALLMAANGGKPDGVETSYCVNERELQCSIRHDKKNFIIVLVGEAKTSANI